MKDRENELHHHLELITNIAQRIDNENRALMKKNQELKGEYRAQENDRELLVKQLVMQKKENAKVREEIEFYDRIIQEKGAEDDEEEVDVEKLDTASHAYGGLQSKIGNKRDISALNNNNQRSQLNTRGTNRSQSNANVIGGITQTGPGAPLVYIPR